MGGPQNWKTTRVGPQMFSTKDRLRDSNGNGLTWDTEMIMTVTSSKKNIKIWSLLCNILTSQKIVHFPYRMVRMYIYIYIYSHYTIQLENSPGCLTVEIHHQAAERVHWSMLPGFIPCWIFLDFLGVLGLSQFQITFKIWTFMIYLFMDIHRFPIYLWYLPYISHIAYGFSCDFSSVP